MTDYDAVRYPCKAYSQTHPSHLYVMGRLHGLRPADPARCRVLEIGCGDGGNLVPMAHQFPESRFFGFDLAETTIVEGQAVVRDLGLKNLELRHLDLMEFPESEGPFDYIIAHGFYSWVPDFVREQMLGLVKRLLSEQGIAFVSYNAYPGGHIRTMLREMVLFHVKNAPDAQAKLDQARAFLGFLEQGMLDIDEHGRLHKAEVERVLKFDPAHYFHDDIAEINQAYYVHEFVARAEQHGLKYVEDADFPSTQDNRFPPEVREKLAGLADKPGMREQYLDFLKFRRFRQTLLCHAEAGATYAPQPAVVRELYTGGGIAAGDKKAGEWISPGGARLRSTHPVAMAAFAAIAVRWPGRYDFATLAQDVMSKTGGPIEAVEEVLEKVLWEGLIAGMLEAWPVPEPFARTVSEKPQASGLVRYMLQHGDAVVTLLHTTVSIGDAIGRQLVSLLDGTRDREALVNDMADSQLLREMESDPKKRLALAKSHVDTGLPQLLKLALLEK